MKYNFTGHDINYIYRRIKQSYEYDRKLDEVVYKRERDVLRQEQDKVDNEVIARAGRFTVADWDALLDVVGERLGRPDLSEVWNHNQINAYALEEECSC